MASGSTVADRFSKPAGLGIVSLPPVLKTGVDEYDSWESRIPISLVRRARSAVLVDVITRWKPDVLLVDHAPQGMRGELLPVFRAVEDVSPDTRVILGLRDILDDPSHVREVWRSDGVYETIRDVYDKVLVYGQPEILDVSEAYSLGSDIANKLVYCGYVTPPPPIAPVAPPGLPLGTNYVLGTIGGGGDGVEVLRATLRAAQMMGIGAVISSGPLMSQADRKALEELVAVTPQSVAVDLIDDLPGVCLGASCIVTRGGYNTLSELIPLRVPIVVVPRIWPRTEQLIRARSFDSLGLLKMVEPDHPDFEDALHDSIKQAVESPPRPASDPIAVDLGGLSRVCEALADSLSINNRLFKETPQLIKSRS